MSLFGSGDRGAASYWTRRASPRTIGRLHDPSSIIPAPMKINLSGSRSLAISAIAGLFGWMIASSDSSDMARYHTMSKDAIVAELASKQTSTAASLTISLFIVLGIVVAVDVLTGFFDAAWRRISPDQDGSAPPTA